MYNDFGVQPRPEAGNRAGDLHLLKPQKEMGPKTITDLNKVTIRMHVFMRPVGTSFTAPLRSTEWITVAALIMAENCVGSRTRMSFSSEG